MPASTSQGIAAERVCASPAELADRLFIDRTTWPANATLKRITPIAAMIAAPSRRRSEGSRMRSAGSEDRIGRAVMTHTFAGNAVTAHRQRTATQRDE